MTMVDGNLQSYVQCKYDADGYRNKVTAYSGAGSIDYYVVMQYQ